MYYTPCKIDDLGLDTVKVIRDTEAGAKEEGDGAVLALDIRYGERPDKFYSNRVDDNGFPRWRIEAHSVSEGRWVIKGPIPRWVAVEPKAGGMLEMTSAEIQRSILKVVQDSQPSSGASVHDSVITEKTGLTVQDVRDRLDLLAEQRMVKLKKTTGGFSVWLEPRGRLALKGLSEGVTVMPVSPVNTSRIFITYGHCHDWFLVRNYIEKDIGIDTLELSDVPSQGRTIITMLEEESRKCNYAVIVMTGDDRIGADEVRARENVIHEIGFFQGRYGLNRVCLVYEQGVNIPSNISGLGYCPYPKGMVKAAFADLRRQIEAAFSN